MSRIVAIMGALALVASPLMAQSPVSVSITAKPESVAAGSQSEVEVVFELQPGYHIYPHAEALPEGIREIVTPTSAAIVDQSGTFRITSIEWRTPPHDMKVDLGAGPVSVPVLSGRVQASLRILVPAAVGEGEHNLILRIGYQACTETVCTMPAKVDLPLKLQVRGAAVTTSEARPFKVSIFGLDITIDPQTATGLGLWLLLAAASGMLLNLMPCVLPMISIKIEILRRYAGSQKRTAWLGFMMFAGIVTFWSFLGVLVAFVSGFGGVSGLFQTPLFTITAGVFMGFMGILMLREYVLELPGVLNAFNPMAKNSSGAFLFGVMQALFATACAAPFLGTAIAWAVSEGRPLLALATFVAGGVGMGLPLWILSLLPGARSLVPGGDWGVVVKKALGCLMLGAALYFIGAGHNGLLARYPYLGKIQHIIAAMACFVFGAALVFRHCLSARSAIFPRVVLAGLSLAIAGASAYTAWSVFRTEQSAHEQKSVWKPYDATAFERARAQGKVVVVDFTADWCINCKVLEQTVLKTRATEEMLEANEVECFVADVTSGSGPGYLFMRQLGKGDPPLLVVYGPGLPEGPILSNAYTSHDLADYVSRAKAGKR